MSRPGLRSSAESNSTEGSDDTVIETPVIGSTVDNDNENASAEGDNGNVSVLSDSVFEPIVTSNVVAVATQSDPIEPDPTQILYRTNCICV